MEFLFKKLALVLGFVVVLMWQKAVELGQDDELEAEGGG